MSFIHDNKKYKTVSLFNSCKKNIELYMNVIYDHFKNKKKKKIGDFF